LIVPSTALAAVEGFFWGEQSSFLTNHYLHAYYLRLIPISTKKLKGAFMTKILSLLKNEDGATAIEYGLIAALISIVCIAALSAVGVNLTNTFNGVANNLTQR
jgi:pilus assembly protein Flp/PilA